MSDRLHSRLPYHYWYSWQHESTNNNNNEQQHATSARKPQQQHQGDNIATKNEATVMTGQKMTKCSNVKCSNLKWHLEMTKKVPLGSTIAACAPGGGVGVGKNGGESRVRVQRTDEAHQREESLITDDWFLDLYRFRKLIENWAWGLRWWRVLTNLLPATVKEGPSIHMLNQ